MTKNELIADLKKQYPTLFKTINNEDIDLTPSEYEARINEWAENILAQKEIDAKREVSLAKLAALGLEPDDLKALGL